MAVGTRTLRKGELLSILGEIYRDRDSGTLVLQQGDVSRFLYIQEGMVIFAASNAAEDKFTQILIEKGKLTAEQLALATEKKESRTIGRTLVDMGFLGSEDLLDALVEQLRKIALSAVNWDGGTASFKPGVLPPNVAKLPVSTPRFLVDLALAIQDRELVASSLGQLDAPVLLSAAEREAARAIPPSAQEARILEQIDGKRSAREICERAGVDLFSGSRFLLGLSHLGLLHVRQIIAPATSSRSAPGPVDLSFLDSLSSESPATGVPNPSPEVPQAPPTPQGLPFAGDAQPEKPPSRPPAAAPVPSLSKAAPHILPELLPSPAADGPPAARAPEPPAFMAESSAPARGRWLIFVLVVAVLLGGGAGSVWYFFLRPSGVIPVEPKPAVHRKDAQTRPISPGVEPSKPSPTAPVGAQTQPVQTPPPAPVAAPAPVATLHVAPAEKHSASPQTASAASTPAPPPKAAPPEKPAPATPVTGEGWDLLAKGQYPEAARAFRQAFKERKGGFVVNIEVACQADTVAKGLAAAEGRRDYSLLPYDLKGRPCFIVLWGYYPDKATADAALGQLPAFFRQAAQPRVVAWSKIVELTGSASP